MLKSLGLVLILLVVSGCDWFSRSGPPAQQKYEREEIYAHHNEKGVYRCTKCGTVLFSSEKKMQQQTTRWPVFSEGEPGAVRSPKTPLTTEDSTKVVCAHCNLQVGHLCRGGELLTGEGIPDGAAICALSSSLKFEARP